MAGRSCNRSYSGGGSGGTDRTKGLKSVIRNIERSSHGNHLTDYSDPAVDRRASDVALQQRMGILPERRHRFDSAYHYYPGFDGQNITRSDLWREGGSRGVKLDRGVPQLAALSHLRKSDPRTSAPTD